MREHDEDVEGDGSSEATESEQPEPSADHHDGERDRSDETPDDAEPAPAEAEAEPEREPEPAEPDAGDAVDAAGGEPAESAGPSTGAIGLPSSAASAPPAEPRPHPAHQAPHPAHGARAAQDAVSAGARAVGAHLHTIHDDVRSRRPGLGLLAVVAVVAAVIGGVAGGLIATTALASHASPSTLPSARAPIAAAPGSGTVASAAARAEQSVVTLDVHTSTRKEVGSGVVLSADGYVVTNAHVITLDGTVTNATVTARTPDGRVVPTSVVGIDHLADLAVLKLDGVADLEPAEFGDSSSLVVGQQIVVVGSPLGLVDTVTAGIVSNTNRSIEIKSGGAPSATADPSGANDQAGARGGVQLSVVQTDAAINPGNSGGAVVDLDGRVVGIAVAIATANSTSGTSTSQGSIGLGFVIPIGTADRIIRELSAGRMPTHGALGATVTDASTITTSGSSTVGAYVDALSETGAAARAGLRRGDVVVAVDGVPVTKPGDLIGAVRVHEAGSTVTLTILRQGERLDVNVTLDSAA